MTRMFVCPICKNLVPGSLGVYIPKCGQCNTDCLFPPKSVSPIQFIKPERNEQLMLMDSKVEEILSSLRKTKVMLESFYGVEFEIEFNCNQAVNFSPKVKVNFIPVIRTKE